MVDQLFNSNEKRLARILLPLARYGKEGQPERILPEINKETLAQTVGTTRQQISNFMNKFRRLGFIQYNGGLKFTAPSPISFCTINLNAQESTPHEPRPAADLGLAEFGTCPIWDRLLECLCCFLRRGNPATRTLPAAFSTS